MIGLIKRCEKLISKTPVAHQFQLCRLIFNETGIWDHPLTIDVKKKIDNYWGPNVNKSCLKAPETNGEKMYILPTFTYERLNIGHFRLHCVADCFARYHRMNGKNVIFPIGWSSFGTWVEEAALADGTLPDAWVKNYLADANNDTSKYGLSFNNKQKINTSAEEYIKWVQYLFLKLFENGLIYRRIKRPNKLAQTLENEEAIKEGASVCNEQEKFWFLAISKYSKSLLDGLNDPLLNLEAISNEHNIGTNMGYCFNLSLVLGEEAADLGKLDVWSDKPELLYGVTYIIISRFHHLNQSKYYRNEDLNSDEIRLKLDAIHPLSQRKIPIFVCLNNPCIMSTQSYLGIPGEILEDQHFAAKHNLPFAKVVDENKLINSDKFTGLDLTSGCQAIVKEAIEGGYCYEACDRQRDPLISHQQKWGTPIPIIHCHKCGEVPVPHKDLPVLVPKLKENQSGFQIVNENEWINVKCPKCDADAKRDTDALNPNFDCSWSHGYCLNSHATVSSILEGENILKSNPVNLFIESTANGNSGTFYARFINHFCNDIGLIDVREPIHKVIRIAPAVAKAYYTKSPRQYVKTEDVQVDNYQMFEKNTNKPVSYDTKTMSRSKFNDVSPCKFLDRYSIDTSRLLLLSETAARKFHWPLPDGTVVLIEKFERRLWHTVRCFIGLKQTYEMDIDKKNEEIMFKYNEDLFDIRNYYLKSINFAFNGIHKANMAVTCIMQMLGGLSNLKLGIAFKCPQYERALITLILASFPLMPHLSSELWTRLRKVCQSTDEYDMNKDIYEQKWPEVDQHYHLDLNLAVDYNDCGYYKMRRDTLESLSSEQAINMAFDSPYVTDAIGNKPISKVNYSLVKQSQGNVNIITEGFDSDKNYNKFPKQEENSIVL